MDISEQALAKQVITKAFNDTISVNCGKISPSRFMSITTKDINLQEELVQKIHLSTKYSQDAIRKVLHSSITEFEMGWFDWVEQPDSILDGIKLWEETDSVI